MKKLLFVLLVVLSLVGCASTSASEDSFITEYDDIKNVTYITHSDLDIGYFYNLKDSISGERENIRVYIANDSLILSVNYQWKNWAFFDSAVFLANGSRLQIALDNRTSSIVNGNIVREQFSCIMSEADIDALLAMLSADSVQVAFTGKYTTEKLKIPPKIINAMRATILEYRK